MGFLSCRRKHPTQNSPKPLCRVTFGQTGVSSPKNPMKRFCLIFAILFALLNLIYFANAENEADWMPDANLRQVVRSRLGLAEDALLTQQALSKLRTLTAIDSDIRDLVGLEHATALTKLNLQDNRISDVSSLSSLGHLKWLYLGKNNISDVSALSSLTNLRHLSLQNNRISDISALSSLRKLTGLGLGNNISNANGNTISDVSSLSNMQWLYWLFLENNHISDVNALSSLTGLRILRLSGNNISDVNALSNLTKLYWLFLHNNTISDVSPLSNLMGLYWLFLDNNNISDVNPLSGLTNLAVLALHGNRILDTSSLYPLVQQRPPSFLITIEISAYPPWDVNADGSVNTIDLALVTAALTQSGEEIVNLRMDVNGDGTVSNDDLLLVNNHLDAEGEEEYENAAPAVIGGIADRVLSSAKLRTLESATLQMQLDIGRTESDGNLLKYQPALVLIEGLLAGSHPSETRLLANYPNPFNPETWIPYQLAKDAEVSITIYGANGSVVRKLTIGHQLAGYYTRRARAVYWDGRNAMGEPVASGIYFYMLTAGDFSATRKMLILK